jgi:transcription termination factor Rho
MATTERDVLEAKVLPELQAIASSMGVQGYFRLRKADLIGAIIAKAQGKEFTPATPSTRSRRATAEAKAATEEQGQSAPSAAEPAATAAPAPAAGDAGADPPARAEQAAPPAADPAPVATTAGEAQVQAQAAATQAPAEQPAPQLSGAEAAAALVEAAADQAAEQVGVSRRTRRRRSRGTGDDAESIPSLLDLPEGGGGTTTTKPAPNGEPAAPAADGGANGSATDKAAASDAAQELLDGQVARRNWDQGNRWDAQQSSGTGRRSRRNRNRNRNNRFSDGGGVAVADRPEFRGGNADDRPEVTRKGILDIRSQDGYGFLRVGGYLPGADDVYVPLSMIRRLGLRRGDEVEGSVKLPREGDKYAALARVDKVNELDPEEARGRRDFKDLTPLYPNERLRLEHSPTEISTRVMDLMSPIGKGQRGLIVSPPKAGKTMLMKQIANAISENNPEVHLIILLVDERPEEVTDMQRSTRAEVVYSTFDRPSDDHCQISELTIERAKRLVEYGKDVMILLDGITRLSRAYNLATPASGKILSGGVDSSALYPPKRFFGAARNIENGGSLTILATALVDTGSRMDEVIFEEFKGTGNMEVRLDRKLSERRIYPALDIDGSSTRKEELLLTQQELVVAWKLRRVLGALEPAQALELVVDKMRASKTNAQFLQDIQRANMGS